MLQNMVPEGLANKISDLLLAMAKDALDNMDEHLELRKKHNLGQIAAIDQRDRFIANLRKTFEMVKRGEEYFRFMHLRTVKEKEAQAADKQAPVQNVVGEDEEEEFQLDEEELEQIKRESMSGLFMTFKIGEAKDVNKKRPPLPPRGSDIDEDSMEDMISADLNESMTQRQEGKVGHSKKMSIDTDTILKGDRLNTSMGSDGGYPKGTNALPLPEPLNKSIQITEAYLKQFNKT